MERAVAITVVGIVVGSRTMGPGALGVGAGKRVANCVRGSKLLILLLLKVNLMYQLPIA